MSQENWTNEHKIAFEAIKQAIKERHPHFYPSFITNGFYLQRCDVKTYGKYSSAFPCLKIGATHDDFYFARFVNADDPSRCGFIMSLAMDAHSPDDVTPDNYYKWLPKRVEEITEFVVCADHAIGHYSEVSDCSH